VPNLDFQEEKESWKCEFIDGARESIRQDILITQKDSSVSFAFQDSVAKGFADYFNSVINHDNQVIGVSFGPTTYVYTPFRIVIFRRCSCQTKCE
jgi:hypothetical protein